MHSTYAGESSNKPLVCTSYTANHLHFRTHAQAVLEASQFAEPQVHAMRTQTAFPCVDLA